MSVGYWVRLDEDGILTAGASVSGPEDSQKAYEFVAIDGYPEPVWVYAPATIRMGSPLAPSAQVRADNPWVLAPPPQTSLFEATP